MSDYLDDRVSGESYRALESERDTLRNENLSGMQEIDRLKAELEREKPFFDEALLVLKDRDAWKLKAEKAEKQESIVREVSGNRLELWIKAEKKAEKLAKALKAIADQTFDEQDMTSQDVACAVLAEFEK